ncbi:MAG: type I methionyl aminopeptidase, partial [Minisyncoccales bacterium]
PFIPNFGQKGTGLVLKEGMTLCLEPMLSSGDFHLRKVKDGFGFETIDHSLTAHFEETIFVGKKKAEILTKK